MSTSSEGSRKVGVKGRRSVLNVGAARVACEEKWQ